MLEHWFGETVSEMYVTQWRDGADYEPTTQAFEPTSSEAGAVPPPQVEPLAGPDLPGWDDEPDPNNSNLFWDEGSAYDGGGAFGGTLGGFYFHINGDDETPTVDEVVVTGQRRMDEEDIALILSRLTYSPEDDFFTVEVAALDILSGEHLYGVENQVGDSACDVDEAWEGLLRNAAPGQNGPAHDGKIVHVPHLGTVTQYVDETTMSVINVTNPDHDLHPGTVVRQIVVENGAVHIRTTGEGGGPLAALNEWLAGPVWGGPDAQIAQYVDANDNGPGDC